MRTVSILDAKHVPDVLQVQAFPLFDRRNGFQNGESLIITGLWEFEGGVFGYDFGNINHVVHATYINENNLELVVTDRVLEATFIHEDGLHSMESPLKVIKRHMFTNVFEATTYYATIMAVKAQQTNMQ